MGHELFTLLGTISINSGNSNDEMDKMIEKAGKLGTSLNSASSTTTTKGNTISNTFKQVADNTSKALSSLNVMFGNLATQGMNKLYDFGKGFLQTGYVYNTFVEKQIANFKTLLQTTEEDAASFFGELEQFAIETPLSLEGAVETATKLLGVGVERSALIETMQMLGDLALGDTTNMERLAKALTDVQANTTFLAQEGRQTTEIGVPIWRLLSEYYTATDGTYSGYTAGELKAMNKKQFPISYEDYLGALQMAVAPGGMFYDAMQTAMTTTEGKAERMKDDYRRTAGAVTKAITEIFASETIPALNEILQQLDEWANDNPDALTNLGQAFSDFATGGLKLLTDGLTELLTFWNTNRAAFDSFLVLLGGIALYTKHPAAGVALIGTGAADLYNAASRNAEEDLPGLGSEEDTLDEMGASAELRNAVETGDYSNVSDEEYSKYKSKKLINSIMAKAYGLEEEFAKTADNVVSLVSGEASTGASDLVNSVGDAMNYKRLLERYNPNAVGGFSIIDMWNGLMNDQNFFINKWRREEVDPDADNGGGGRRFGQPSIELPDRTDGLGGSNSIPALIAAVQALTAENQSAPEKVSAAITTGLSGVSFTTNVNTGDVLLDGVSVGRQVAPHVNTILGGMQRISDRG